MSIIEMLRQKRVYIVVGIAILISFVCIIGIIMPGKEYSLYGNYYFTEGIAEHGTVIYDEISLSPGVYDVILEYDTNTSMKNLCYLEDGTVYTGGLLTNGENLHKNLKHTDFRMWLFEGTQNLQMKVLYGGEGTLITGNLTIRETNALWTMLLTITWGVVIAVCAMFAFGKYDKAVGVDKEKKNIFWGLVCIAILASVPCMQNANLTGGDLGYHLMRIEGIKDGLKSGQFPIRIEPEWLFGHGYANSVFYCSTLLYFPAILRLLGFTVMTSYNAYCIAVTIATVGVAYYCFAGIFKDRYIGLLCSGLYTFSVIRIFHMFFRAAVGEYSALIFMPLVLYGLYRAFTEDIKSKSYKNIWIPITIGYAGLIQTHVLTCEITAFLTIIICLILIKKVFVKETFCVLAKGALGAFFASCWYLIPFLDYYLNEDLHVHYVSGRTIQERGLYPAQVFFHWWKAGHRTLTNYEGMAESNAMGVGLVLGIGLAVFFVFWFSGKWKGTKEPVIGLSKISWILGSVLIVLSLSIFPWDKLQSINDVSASLISSLQFPVRFLSWGTVFLVVVFGSLLWYFKESDRKQLFYAGAVVVIVSICTSGIYLADYLCRDRELVRVYNEEGMGFGYVSGGEYLIQGTDTSALDFGILTFSENVEVISYESGALCMNLHCINYGEDGEYVELPLLHYNGYRAFDTQTGEELNAVKGTNNVVRVYLPGGFKGEIEVRFVSPIHWRISELVTYVWWICIGVIVVKNRVSKEKREVRNAGNVE